MRARGGIEAMNLIQEAIEQLRQGRAVLIYDAKGREEETDLVVAAEHATPEQVRRMRKDGGGLLCAAIHPRIAGQLGLPFLTEVWGHAIARFPVFKDLWPHDIPYDEKSAFSITINHRKTFTGISDFDRSLTITELARIGAKAMNGHFKSEEFGRSFRSPGHVVLLRAAEGLLAERKGHTELSVALMEMAGLTPIAAICEMLSDDHRSLPLEEAERYASREGLVLLEGKEVMEVYLEERKAVAKAGKR